MLVMHVKPFFRRTGTTRLGELVLVWEAGGKDGTPLEVMQEETGDEEPEAEVGRTADLGPERANGNSMLLGSRGSGVLGRGENEELGDRELEGR